jgi:hypothetical protein
MNHHHIITVKILDQPGAGGGCASSDLTRTPEYAAAVRNDNVYLAGRYSF